MCVNRLVYWSTSVVVVPKTPVSLVSERWRGVWGGEREGERERGERQSAVKRRVRNKRRSKLTNLLTTCRQFSIFCFLFFVFMSFVGKHVDLAADCIELEV